MDWVGQLRNRNDVEWRKIKPALQEWDHKEQGLTEAGAALVALAVTAVSAGTFAQFSAALASAFLAGMQSTTAAALKASMTSLATRSTVALINNGGDLGATLKALVTAMLSAGLTSGITDAVGLGGTLPVNATVAQRATFTLQRNLVRTTVNAGVSTAIQGGKFDKALLNVMRTAAASTIGEITANEIGVAYSKAAVDGKDIGEYLVHKAAHNGLGCATATIGNGDCGSGAQGSAAVSEGYQAITQPQLTEELNDLRTELSGQNLSDTEIDARLNAQFQD
ncbi:MAG: DUF637 domain-containing protein [Hyphomicrobiaceae bacterium]|nr:DUF637 domain-containing protein [Hyphomicrobiaceae bacterium]